ncbi:MAG TPA: extracellular solute-binding protein [Spirochaetota bacterium]|nr:extracellular solute-binding protein [Spirochaetota bacterium]
MFKIIFSCCQLLILFFLLACGGSPGSDKTKLYFMLWGSADQRGLWHKLKKDFEEKNPDIQLILHYSTFKGYEDKLLTLLAAQSEKVDLCRIAEVTSIASRGTLADLSPYYKNDKLPPLRDFYINTVSNFTYNGKQYAVAYSINVYTIFVNSGIAEQKNVTVPQGDYSFNTYKTFVKNLSSEKPKRVYGCGTDINPLRYLPLIWNRGGRIYRAEDNSINFDIPETRYVLKMFKKFIENKYMAPLDADQQGGFSGFQNGTSATYAAGQYLIPELRKKVNFKWQMMPFPLKPGESRFAQGFDNKIAVRRGSKKREEALRFLKYLLTADAAQILARGGDYIPPLKSLNADKAVQKRIPYDTAPFIKQYQKMRRLFYDKHKDKNQIGEGINKEVWTYLLQPEASLDKCIHNIHHNLSKFYKIRKQDL